MCVGFRATRARAQKEKTSLSWEETLRQQSTRAFLRVPDPYVRHKEQMEYFDKRAYDFFRSSVGSSREGLKLVCARVKLYGRVSL